MVPRYIFLEKEVHEYKNVQNKFQLSLVGSLNTDANSKFMSDAKDAFELGIQQ